MQVFSIKKQIVLKKPLKTHTSNVLNSIFQKNPNTKYKEICSYAKIYPDSIKIIKYHRPIVFPNFSESSEYSTSAILMNEENSEENDYLQKSINRTKTKISDYVLCNNFSHFATFTFDPRNPKVKSEENRHDFQKMSSLLKNWLKTEQLNHFRRHGRKFLYLIVPERHKNGAWHFHALLEGYQNETEGFYTRKNKYITVSELKKTKKDKNRKFIVRYKLGRSEIAPIKDKTKMSSYIKKYITKELIQDKNAKRYWASRNLKTPEIIPNFISESQKIPEQFLTAKHDYHNIYIIPKESSYFSFSKYVNKLENHFKRENFHIKI